MFMNLLHVPKADVSHVIGSFTCCFQKAMNKEAATFCDSSTKQKVQKAIYLAAEGLTRLYFAIAFQQVSSTHYLLSKSRLAFVF